MTGVQVELSAATSPGRNSFPFPGGPSLGVGERLVGAIAALERFPALTYSRDRLLEVLDAETVSAHEAVEIIESDPALTIGALRLANRARSRYARPICGIPAAVARVAPDALREFARQLPVFEFFGHGSAWSTAAQHFRVHAVATLHAAERHIREGMVERPDELRVGAMLHDIGKLVVVQAYGEYATGSRSPSSTRLATERRKWGLDHAVLGGILARRLGLPNEIASLIERHHSDGEKGDAALLRLSDLIVHYAAGHPVDQRELSATAQACGLVGASLDHLLYEAPDVAAKARRIEPSPFTERQTDVLNQLAHGSQYKEIAEQLGVSRSTVRAHLHAVYVKLGVSDRAQAVLLAARRGWLP